MLPIKRKSSNTTRNMLRSLHQETASDTLVILTISLTEMPNGVKSFGNSFNNRRLVEYVRDVALMIGACLIFTIQIKA